MYKNENFRIKTLNKIIIIVKIKSIDFNKYVNISRKLQI